MTTHADAEDLLTTPDDAASECARLRELCDVHERARRQLERDVAEARGLLRKAASFYPWVWEREVGEALKRWDAADADPGAFERATGGE